MRWLYLDDVKVIDHDLMNPEQALYPCAGPGGIIDIPVRIAEPAAMPDFL